MESPASKFKSIYSKVVIENPAAQDLLLKSWKSVQRKYCWVRSIPNKLRAVEYPNQNIFHASIQKTGSHWIKSIFTDKRILAQTGLKMYPGHRYEWDEFHKRLPKQHFVPALFISYWQYEEIIKPENYKTFYVIRDPRNVIVSWYYSMLNSHRLAGKVPKFRSILNELGQEKGIEYAIKVLAYKFSFMRSWIYNSDDPNVLIVKFEDMTHKPVETFQKIFRHCDLEFSNDQVAEVLGDYTKEAMRGKEQKRSFLRQRRSTDSSHYRKNSDNWEEVFSDRNYDFFKETNGNLLELLGYE